MALGWKSKGILGVLALVLLVGAWQGLRYWWNYAYSRGTRTGVIGTHGSWYQLPYGASSL